jgi:hypothetical protein
VHQGGQVCVLCAVHMLDSLLPQECQVPAAATSMPWSVCATVWVAVGSVCLGEQQARSA